MRALLVLSLLVLLAAPAQAEVRVIDTTTGATTVPVTAETSLRGWSDDGSALVVAHRDAVTRLDLASGAVTALPEPLRAASSIGPGGRWVDIDFRASAVVVHAPDGRAIARVGIGSFWNNPEVTWSRDGGRVAISAMGLFVVLDTATGARLMERDRGYDFTPQAFAPDGSALLASDETRIVRFDLTSGRATTVHRSKRVTFPAAVWSPDGRIAFTFPHGVGVAGFPTLRVPTDGAALWSGDGTTLRYLTPTAVLCSFGGNGVSVGAPGQTPRLLLEGTESPVAAALWSPVGATLAVAVGGPAAIEPRGKRHPWPKRIPREFNMSTPGGNAALRRIVQRAARALRNGAGREETLLRVRQDYHRLPKRYDEATDTIVREAVAKQIDRWLRAAGFDPVEAYQELTYC